MRGGAPADRPSAHPAIERSNDEPARKSESVGDEDRVHWLRRVPMPVSRGAHAIKAELIEPACGRQRYLQRADGLGNPPFRIDYAERDGGTGGR